MEKENLNYYVEFGEHYVHITERQKHYLEMRSVVDRVLAAAALIVLSPLLLVVSVAQKISAPDEPIFFLQKRVGKDAHCFNIIKFRTMKSTESNGVCMCPLCYQRGGSLLHCHSTLTIEVHL